MERKMVEMQKEEIEKSQNNKRPAEDDKEKAIQSSQSQSWAP